MRSLGGSGAARFRAAHRMERERVWIADHEGNLQDVTAWVRDWSVDVSVDQQAMRARVTLHSMLGGAVPPPFDDTVTGLPVTIERAVRIETAVVEVGQTIETADWENIFEGHTDDVSSSEPGVLTCPCRGPFGKLMDEWVDDVETATGAAEVAMQAILDERYGVNEIEVRVIGTPAAGVYAQRWQDIKVAEALTKIADLSGSEIRYMWNDTASRWDLTFFRVPEPTATAFEFGPDDYYALADIGLYTSERRREIVVLYGTTGRAVATDETWAIGQRLTRMGIDARDDPQVPNEAAALAWAAAAGRAVFLPPTRKTVRARHFPWIELHDFVRFTGNGVHYLGHQDMAVTEYRHSRAAGPENGPIPPIQTDLTLYKRPHGAVGRWFARADVSDLLRSIPREEPAPVVLGGILLYTTKSGSAGYSLESEAEDSLGRFASTTGVGFGLNAIFRDITDAERVSGITLYKTIAVANLHPTATWEHVAVWIRDQDTGSAWSIWLDTVGVVPLEDTTDQGASLTNETTAPTGAVWTAPVTLETGEDIGDMAPETVQLIHIRLVVTAASVAQVTGASLCFQTCVPV